MNTKKIKLGLLSPAYPPAVNGLGDYAYTLGEKLKAKGIELIYLNSSGQQNKVQSLFVKNNSAHLAKLIKQEAITHLYINYSNYGYQNKGIPFWLLTAVKNAKRNTQNLQTLVFFHELYASGKPWQSVFWLKQLQRKLFQRLYNLADKAFCSNERVFNIIRNETLDAGQKCENIGIFSNIPEPALLTPFEERKKMAIAFGTAGRKKNIYANKEKLNAFLAHYNIDRLIDLGPGFQEEWAVGLNIKPEEMGKLSAVEISDCLQQAQVGLIDYPCSLLGKSGIFAAYAAHGLAVVNFTQDPSLALDGLKEGEHFCYADSKKIGSEILSQHLNKWYSERNLYMHSSEVWKHLNNS